MSLSTAAPRHGDVRHRRTETDSSETVVLRDARTGTPVHIGPLATHSYSVDEAYCATCQIWVERRGLLGTLAFDFEHRHEQEAIPMTAPFAEPSGAVFVLREPGTQNEEWHVSFNGRVCSPTWRQRGPAQAYLDALVSGTRKPEYSA